MNRRPTPRDWSDVPFPVLQLDDAAEQLGFIVAYPQGIVDHKSGFRWSFPYRQEPSGAQQPDDVGFIRKVVRTTQSYLRVDRKRIYATGFSSGGKITQVLGVECADVFAAVAPVAGGIGGLHPLTGQPAVLSPPQQNMPVLFLFGRKDDKFPATPYALSADQVAMFWVKGNHCDPQPNATTKNNGKIEIERYQDTAGKIWVTYVTYPLAHEWPRASNGAGFSGTSMILRFFAANPKP